MSSATAEQAVSCSSHWRFLKNNVAVRNSRISLGPQREGVALQRLRACCSQAGAPSTSTLQIGVGVFMCCSELGHGYSSPCCVASLLLLLLLCNHVTIVSTQTAFINLRLTKSKKKKKRLHLANKTPFI